MDFVPKHHNTNIGRTVLELLLVKKKEKTKKEILIFPLFLTHILLIA